MLAAKFGKAADQTALSLPKGHLAISVQLTDPARVAGFVEPGSSVTIFATESVDPQNGKKPFDTAFTLLPKVTVIAVGPTTVTQANDTSGSGNKEALPRTILTIAVTQLEAQRVLLADLKGELSFGLLGTDSGPTRTRPTVVNDLFS